MMNVHFAAATPNLRIMEVDVDRLPWDHELFTAAPQFENGHIVVPDTPGWGTSTTKRRSAPIRPDRRRADELSADLERDRHNSNSDLGRGDADRPRFCSYVFFDGGGFLKHDLLSCSAATDALAAPRGGAQRNFCLPHAVAQWTSLRGSQNVAAGIGNRSDPGCGIGGGTGLLEAGRNRVGPRSCQPGGAWRSSGGCRRGQTPSVPAMVPALGTVLSVDTVNVTPRVNGQIVGIYFKQGDEVTRGQPLFLIDPRLIRRSLPRPGAAR